MIALVALLTLEWLAVYGIRKKAVHAALVAALVDFHKVQCFFSSTIQITGLILFHEAQKNSALDTKTIQSSSQDFFDTSILVVLATSGIIPISLTLVCVSRYGRQSWYLLTLSLITMVLATATLTSSYIYAYDYGLPYGVYSSNMQNPYLYNDNKYNNMNATSTTCNIRGSVGHTLYPLCGSWNLVNNAIGTSMFTSHWIWLVWACCIMWLPICTVKHWYSDDESYSKPRSWSFRSIPERHTWIAKLYRELGTCRTWSLFSCVSWSLCFGSQFYLFSLYFKHFVISQQWSFGQIIAVTVWVPSVVEYAYIEYSTFDDGSFWKENTDWS